MISKILPAILFFSFLSFGATIDLKTAGAAGDGITDDSNAIQNAINNSQTGDTIQCSAGTYRLTKSITFKSSRTYQGLAGCILTGAIGGPLVQLEYDNAHDL
ncbi:MAG TPA: glycosyl hydrolase family 28-related protein, partial [Bryobacteraceae bacterium]|nr:glycosyl hydrolase family 28-related protein [Bryobacteraceae bacterium]